MMYTRPIDRELAVHMVVIFLILIRISGASYDAMYDTVCDDVNRCVYYQLYP